MPACLSVCRLVGWWMIISCSVSLCCMQHIILHNSHSFFILFIYNNLITIVCYAIQWNIKWNRKYLNDSSSFWMHSMSCRVYGVEVILDNICINRKSTTTAAAVVPRLKFNLKVSTSLTLLALVFPKCQNESTIRVSKLEILSDQIQFECIV